MGKWIWRVLSGVAFLAVVVPASAQQRPATPSVFVDAAIMWERDPTDFFRGPDEGSGLRGAVGVRLSERHSVRFEVDVPSWRTESVSFTTTFCPPTPQCANERGRPVFRVDNHTAVRRFSYVALYGFHLPPAGPLHISLVGGGGVERLVRRSSSLQRELGVGGLVVDNTIVDNHSTRRLPAAVVGVDAAVRITRYVAMAPQVRYHTFPTGDSGLSIVRWGIALRWQF